MAPARRIAAILLLGGGLLTLVLPLLGGVVIGAGLISLGIAVRGRGRPALLVAGALHLAAAAVHAAQIASGSPLGPGPSQLADLAKSAAVVVAAILVLTDASPLEAVRRTIAVAAGAVALFLLGSLLLPLPGIGLLPGLGFAIGGLLLLLRGAGYVGNSGQARVRRPMRPRTHSHS